MKTAEEKFVKEQLSWSAYHGSEGGGKRADRGTKRMQIGYLHRWTRIIHSSVDAQLFTPLDQKKQGITDPRENSKIAHGGLWKENNRVLFGFTVDMRRSKGQTKTVLGLEGAAFRKIHQLAVFELKIQESFATAASSLRKHN